MNNIVDNIKQRLSLREPLGHALEVVATLTDNLSLAKTHGDKVFLSNELKKAQAVCPNCKDFERDFPSFAFSIATGIGKTRLMAACISYLYLKKGIKHFFILAPNLTLYEKLIRDFGEPSYSKYVFKGITEFVHNSPVVITGDNYEQARGLFSENEVQINVFNIAKFNSDSKDSKKNLPRMKRLSEYIGQSYFDYLTELDDLVILMDEAHRYHADASKKAINELDPILGLEMSATPMDEKGKAFKNIVYEYNLAQALADGKYVKNPTVAKRKNFEKGTLTDLELDRLKLEDGISVHENAKLHLELYAKDNNLPFVKPFILVVCKNIQHATDTMNMIEDKEFFNGNYKGKVLQIDSSTRKDEDVDRLFVSLESPMNHIEIVIHVNMLKEGWDVTNLYTIVPLRAADAPILVEQSIGRGLRLPYGGKRTGNAEVDKLTVIAHENFEAVLSKAKDPDSILNKFSFVELEEEDIKSGLGSTVISTQTAIDKKYKEQVEKQDDEYQKKLAQATFDAKRAVWQVIPSLNSNIKNKEELSKPENIALIKRKTIEAIKQSAKIASPLFAEEEASYKIEEVDKVVRSVVADFIDNVIEIPRLVVEQPRTKAIYDFFVLDTTEGFSLPAMKNEIIRMGLVNGEVETLQAKSSGYYGNPVQQIVIQLMNYDDVDYDEISELLYSLAQDACRTIKDNLQNNEDFSQVIFQFKTVIAERIYKQMQEHFHIECLDFNYSRVLPFVEILPQHLIETPFGRRDYRDVITPASFVNKYIFTGFVKSYYTECKFDSSTEQNFAFVLENDNLVLRWIRPTAKQFNIYWLNGTKNYEPDFVVETEQCIYMIETKRADELEKDSVIAKKEAAQQYCKRASAYTTENGGKPWKYVIVAHDNVSRTVSFEYIIAISM
ncbi:MAG: DEAD/DEAH box helicase family protein [Prevotella sp.]|nr:DEAD/DEAH box helicase family protein [Prevotella sp.]